MGWRYIKKSLRRKRKRKILKHSAVEQRRRIYCVCGVPLLSDNTALTLQTFQKDYIRKMIYCTCENFYTNEIEQPEKAVLQILFSSPHSLTSKAQEENITETISKFELEVLLEYLDDKETGIDTLNKYRNIKKVFIKFNTVIPAAPVERFFSFASLRDAPRRHAMKVNKVGQ